MLQWFRTRSPAHAVALLVSLAALSASSAIPHQDDCHETLCVSTVAPHDPSQHAVQSTPSSSDDHQLHCVVCHWMRLLRPSARQAHAFAHQVERSGITIRDVITVPPVFPAAHPPLRSPPDSPDAITT